MPSLVTTDNASIPTKQVESVEPLWTLRQDGRSLRAELCRTKQGWEVYLLSDTQLFAAHRLASRGLGLVGRLDLRWPRCGRMGLCIEVDSRPLGALEERGRDLKPHIRIEGPPAAAHDRSPHLLLHGPKRAYGPLAYNFACQPMTKRPLRRPPVLRPRCSNFSRPRSNACKRVDQLERESAAHTRRCAEIQADLDRLKKSNASASFPFSSGSRPTPQ